MPRAAALGSLYERLSGIAAANPTAPAILAPGRQPLTFGALVEQIDVLRGYLTDRGIERGDRIALLAPRGPETAVAALGIMCCGTCVALNPQVMAEECKAIFTETKVRALFAPGTADSPALEVARMRRLASIEWSIALELPAGHLRLDGNVGIRRADPTPAPDDIALIVFTSGSTAKPKIVPATHANLIARADKVRRLFALDASDRCLNLMPLCYMHGLSSGLTGPLAAGGSAICPSDFEKETFLACLAQLRPTWYTAAASYHEAILDWLRSRPTAASGHRLRFARSASAPLAADVQEALEKLLGIPIVEGYGTSETGLVTSDPPHGVRKRGTVGVSPDNDIGIIDERDALLPAGVTGEVVVRGPSVSAGYEGDPEATRTAFRNGWYHTGDLGVLDASGYLTLVGRIKELINRGGEKVSPAEVEAVLLAHPSVAQAVSFPVPHLTLREDVWAAVRLHPDRTVSETDLRRFALERLTPFKVPRRIVFTDALPTGPTGKLLRRGLADRFHIAHVPDPSGNDDAPSCTPMERTLLVIFREILGTDTLGLDDDFFINGGDSLSAVTLSVRIEEELKVSVPLLSLMETPTPRQLANSLVKHPPDTTRDTLGINVTGRQRPLYAIGGRFGHAVRLVLLGKNIDPDLPFYGLQPPRMDWEQAGCRTIPEMADHYIRRIRAIQAHGPYRLLGTSFGGLVVFEMALQLQAAGQIVQFLGLVDTQPPTCCWNGRKKVPFIGVAAKDADLNNAPNSAIESAALRVARTHLSARRVYELTRAVDSELTYFYCAGETIVPRRDRRRLWRWFATRGVRLLPISGVHLEFHEEPQFSTLIHHLRSCLTGTPTRSSSFTRVFGRSFRLHRHSGQESIRERDGRVLAITAGGADGCVKLLPSQHRSLVATGWALDPNHGIPAETVLVFLGGKYAGCCAPGIARPDLEDRFAGSARYAGFTLRIPLAKQANLSRSDIRFFAISASGVAAELQRCD